MRPGFNYSRYLRYSLIALAGAVILATAVYFALLKAFPPARIAVVLAEHLNTATGRDFKVNGDISIRFLPSLAVVADDLVLSNAAWGSRPEMLMVKHTAFEIALKPLLNGEVRILKVNLEGADLLLETDRSGRSNWRFSSDQNPVSKSSFPSFGVEQLVITDAKITYRDGATLAASSLFIESLTLAAQGEFDSISASLLFDQQKIQFAGRVGSVLALLAGPADWPFDLHMKLNGSEVSFNGKLGLKPQVRLDGEISSVTVDVEKWLKNNAGAGDAAVSLDVLPSFPVSLGFHVDQLLFPDQLHLSAVQGRLKTESGRLIVEPLSFAAVGGQVSGGVEVADAAGGSLAIVLDIEAKGLSAELLQKKLGGNGLHGGRADLKADLKLKGNSSRKLAASVTGEAQLSVADTRLESSGVALERNLIVSLLQALIPGHSKQQALAISCGVVRLPFVNGVAVVDRSIAIETEQLAISASGKIDLVNQRLELAFRPQVKKGLGLNQSALASLVMLKGPLENPDIVIDPKGTVYEVANIGVAVATGGASLLASRLIGEWSDTNSCRTAISGARGSNSQPARDKVQGWPRRKLAPHD
jgi:uncharacterized protein involved in outer membrane biogenesis